jgi:competence protein ComEC
MKKKKKIALFFAGFLFLLNIILWQEVFYLVEKHNLKVDFLDVGQGDAIFIETPQMHQILIDGGPNSTILKKLSERMPFWDKTIDLIILTHPEKDHLMGLLDVLQRYKVNYVLWTGAVRQTQEYQKWTEILSKIQNKLFFQNVQTDILKEKTKVINIEANTKIKAGKALIDILYPFESLAGKEFKNTTNDSSIVSRLIFNKNSFLFTGDITNNAEKELINKKIYLDSDVLKISHHGSKYSTSDEFLENVKPEIAVISVGKNSYGQPAPEVLQRLENFGIEIKRTDEDGDVEIVSDGENIKINN